MLKKAFNTRSGKRAASSSRTSTRIYRLLPLLSICLCNHLRWAINTIPFLGLIKPNHALLGSATRAISLSFSLASSFDYTANEETSLQGFPDVAWSSESGQFLPPFNWCFLISFQPLKKKKKKKSQGDSKMTHPHHSPFPFPLWIVLTYTAGTPKHSTAYIPINTTSKWAKDHAQYSSGSRAQPPRKKSTRAQHTRALSTSRAPIRADACRLGTRRMLTRFTSPSTSNVYPVPTFSRFFLHLNHQVFIYDSLLKRRPGC